jgi:hypothetical protein
MRLDFKVQGTTGLIANLYGFVDDVQRGILVETDRYGVNTQAGARAFARKKTGKMANEIQDRRSDQGRVAEVGWNLADFTRDGDYPYFYVHELGSSSVSPQPMIGPAHRIHAPIMQRNVSALLRSVSARRSAR